MGAWARVRVRLAVGRVCVYGVHIAIDVIGPHLCVCVCVCVGRECLHHTYVIGS